MEVVQDISANSEIEDFAHPEIRSQLYCSTPLQSPVKNDRSSCLECNSIEILDAGFLDDTVFSVNAYSQDYGVTNEFENEDEENNESSSYELRYSLMTVSDDEETIDAEEGAEEEDEESGYGISMITLSDEEEMEMEVEVQREENMPMAYRPATEEEIEQEIYELLTIFRQRQEFADLLGLEHEQVKVMEIQTLKQHVQYLLANDPY